MLKIFIVFQTKKAPENTLILFIFHILTLKTKFTANAALNQHMRNLSQNMSCRVQIKPQWNYKAGT